jgi:hypothetical protein
MERARPHHVPAISRCHYPERKLALPQESDARSTGFRQPPALLSMAKALADFLTKVLKHGAPGAEVRDTHAAGDELARRRPPIRVRLSEDQSLILGLLDW